MKKLLLIVLVIAGSDLFAQGQSAPYVILVSFDGFRHDYVEKYNAPTFKSIYKKGSYTTAMVPSFPSKTFPNHYTLVTGLYPGHHGIVDNIFYDKAKGVMFYKNDREQVVDPYFYGGVPLWELARQQGMRSASYFWPGSEMSLESRRPEYFFKYDEKVPAEKRIDQAFEWLKLPDTERPHLIALYFSSPDHEGHTKGPEAEETAKAVLKSDSLLNALLTGLKNIDLPVNVIVVSDHGMKEIVQTPDAFIFLSELIDTKRKAVKVTNGGTQADVYMSNPTSRDSLYVLLKSKEKNFKVYKKEEFPDRWYYNTDRVGDLLIVATPGYFMRDTNAVVANPNRGEHGYDPLIVTDMHGIFFAIGPNIRKGVEVPPFQNVNIYPLVAKILGLKIPPIDGKFEILENVYKK
jgi:predicted AlkP superfamily pyrophosphatase or phosphodiesterase